MVPETCQSLGATINRTVVVLGASPWAGESQRESRGGREIRRVLFIVSRPRIMGGVNAMRGKPVAERVGVTRGRYAGAGERNWDLKRAYH
jgi:hypothetical protein